MAALFASSLCGRAFVSSTRALLGSPRQLLHATPAMFKDKPGNVSKGEPRKSRFLKLDENGNEIKPDKKERTPQEAKALEEARKEREQKKKDIRLKQIEIQKKRDMASAAKGAKKGGGGTSV